jgi:hypothetical protein
MMRSYLIVLPSLQADIDDVSSTGEQTHQENPSLDTLENLVRMVNTLVNLQDLHESIVPKLAINPSQEKVYHIPDWFQLSFPCDMLTSAFFSGFQPLRVALIWPCIHRLNHAWRRWSTTAVDWCRELASTYEGPTLCFDWYLGPGLWWSEAPLWRDQASAPRSSSNQANIAERCWLVNDKKAGLDTKTDTSASSQRLEHLEKELEDLKERVRATERLIQDEKNLIASSKQEVEDLTTQLKIELAELSALSQQIVSGEDKDDEAAIVEADRVHLEAIAAIDEFLQ